MRGESDGIRNWDRKSFMVSGKIDILEKGDTLRLME